MAHTVSMLVDDELLYLYVAVRLKARRLELGMTQQDLADKVGLKRSSIANIEGRKQKPPLHLLYSICMTLGLEPLDILPTIAKATTEPERVNVMVDGEHWKVTRKSAKAIRKYLESDEQG